MNRTLDELDALPGVSAVATATLPTGIPSSLPTEVALVEEPIGSRMAAESRAVSPGYFETLRIPILDGELCGRSGGAGVATEVMVNRRFIDRYLNGRSTIGLHLAGQSSNRIAGVVGDVRERVSRYAGPSSGRGAFLTNFSSCRVSVSRCGRRSTMPGGASSASSVTN